MNQRANGQLHLVGVLGCVLLAACGGGQAEAPAPVAAPTPVADPNATADAEATAENPNDGAARDPNAPEPPQAIDMGEKTAAPAARKAFRAGESAQDPNEALTLFARAASLDGNFFGAAYNAGAVAARLGDMAAAERYFNSALTINPTFGPAAAGLATLYQRQPAGGMAKAEQLLRMQLDKKDNAPARAALAQLLVRTNRLDEAQREAIAVLHLDERNARAFLTLGMVYRRQHKFELSQMALGQATEVDPQQGEAFNELGLVYLAKNDKAKAVQAFGKAADASPGVAAIQNNLGVMQTEVGAFKAAVESLRSASELEPSRSEYALNLGNALRGDQQYAGAEKMYKQALQAGNKGALFNLGVLYLDNDIPGKDALTRYRECMGYLQSYSAQVANDPDNGHIAEYLQTAQKAIDTETKRAARDKQRKEKDAAEAAKKGAEGGAAGAKPADTTGGASGKPDASGSMPAKPAGAPPSQAPAAPPPAPPIAAPVKAPTPAAVEQAPEEGKKKGKQKKKGKGGKKRGGR